MHSHALIFYWYSEAVLNKLAPALCVPASIGLIIEVPCLSDEDTTKQKPGKQHNSHKEFQIISPSLVMHPAQRCTVFAS